MHVHTCTSTQNICTLSVHHTHTLCILHHTSHPHIVHTPPYITPTHCAHSTIHHTHTLCTLHPYTTPTTHPQHHTHNTRIQGAKCMPGVPTAWASVGRATATGPSPSQARWWAWKECRYSKSRLEPPTAWCGLLCLWTGERGGRDAGGGWGYGGPDLIHPMIPGYISSKWCHFL